jgi:tRNA(Leu) C34 or U34 (ribose-2'-O)-methylase TrmL
MVTGLESLVGALVESHAHIGHGAHGRRPFRCHRTLIWSPHDHVDRYRDAVTADPSGEPISDDVGVGPHPQPWPEDDRLDTSLLAEGDRRNVADRYRYWRNEAIADDLANRSHPFHVAIENWQHDRNIGTVVRTANAFAAAGVHIVGRRRWNRRGAMVTDRYLRVHHHPTIEALVAWADDAGLPVVGVDNLPGAEPLESATLPLACVLLFGQEGPGLSEPARAACATTLSIAQYGSTRSINAGVAAGIAMHAWVRQHARPPDAARPGDGLPGDDLPSDDLPGDGLPSDDLPSDGPPSDDRPGDRHQAGDLRSSTGV